MPVYITNLKTVENPDHLAIMTITILNHVMTIMILDHVAFSYFKTSSHGKQPDSNHNVQKLKIEII